MESKRERVMKSTIATIGILVLVLIGCGDKTIPASQSRVERASLPVDAMKKSDCFSCHFIQESSYGPSYLRIAGRYKARDVEIRELGEKVQTGGGGLWGGALMSRHPFLEDQEVDAMVSWVLSLADREAALDSLYGAMASIVLTGERSGLNISVFPDEEELYPRDTMELFRAEPRLSGYVPHYRVEASLVEGAGMLPAVLVADGKLRIETTGKYFFRLRGKKMGSLNIGGAQVIATREADQEALVELSEGEHTIRVEARFRDPSEQVVLEWIAPGNEYYSIVPADRFSQ